MFRFSIIRSFPHSRFLLIFTFNTPRRLGATISQTWLKPQSHRIVRFLDRAIGGDLAEIRPIGNVCDDLNSGRMLRLLLRLVVGHRTIGGTLGRAITNDWRRLIARSVVGNRETSRMISRLYLRPLARSVVYIYDQSHDWSHAVAASRAIGRRSFNQI